FIDELDAIGKARGIGGALSGHDEREQTLNQLLAEMDGFEANTGVIIMAATNRPEILDAALMRPGRFDRQVLVDRPDLSGRRAILDVHVGNIKLASDVDLDRVAQQTPGLVGADLANIVNEAALLAARHDHEAVTMGDFQEAIERGLVGLEKKTRIMRPEERRRIAYHESGHALVGEFVKTGDPVLKISIIPRGMNALGHTLQMPTEDRYLMTRGELIDKLTILLGGRTAEELVFGEVSTGAQNDLQRAAEIARAMVLEFGMSERFGAMTFERERRPLFLEMGAGGSSRDYSEKTAETIDAEVELLIRRSADHARSILEENRAMLDKVAQALLGSEMIDRARLLDLMGKPPEIRPAPAAAADTNEPDTPAS
ncbi:MAG: AAA family ATPase, partial [Myxococcales bacterium]|nr:AAA family ATPase [Myxococcales bacterium]